MFSGVIGNDTERAKEISFLLIGNEQIAKQSVEVLARLEPRVLATGHGKPIAGDEVPQELRAFATRLAGHPVSS
jgi:hypothetical protein